MLYFLFSASNEAPDLMAEFICRVGTPSGEVITRTVEAPGAQEARARFESQGYRVFSVTPPKASGVATITRGGRAGMRARAGSPCRRGRARASGDHCMKIFASPQNHMIN